MLHFTIDVPAATSFCHGSSDPLAGVSSFSLKPQFPPRLLDCRLAMQVLRYLSIAFALSFSFVAAVATTEHAIEHRKLFWSDAKNAIQDQFIVILDSSVTNVQARANRLVFGTQGRIFATYETVFKGFAVRGLALKFLFRLLHAADVVSVTQVCFVLCFAVLLPYVCTWGSLEHYF